MGSESIAHEAEEHERNNCFSKIQLVGQKNKINKNNNLILILRAFHEMIKHTLHDFYL